VPAVLERTVTVMLVYTMACSNSFFSAPAVLERTVTVMLVYKMACLNSVLMLWCSCSFRKHGHDDAGVPNGLFKLML